MTLKEKLDAIWKDRRIACPSHLVRWSSNLVGWKFSVWKGFQSFDLYYTQGKLTFPRYLYTGSRLGTRYRRPENYIQRVRDRIRIRIVR